MGHIFQPPAATHELYHNCRTWDVPHHTTTGSPRLSIAPLKTASRRLYQSLTNYLHSPRLDDTTTTTATTSASRQTFTFASPRPVVAPSLPKHFLNELIKLCPTLQHLSLSASNPPTRLVQPLVVLCPVSCTLVLDRRFLLHPSCINQIRPRELLHAVSYLRYTAQYKGSASHGPSNLLERKARAERNAPESVDPSQRILGRGYRN